MTTVARALGPAMEKFYARLEPEYSAEDRRKRAENALRLCLEALEQEDVAFAETAFDRMVQRWEEHDDLLSASPYDWGKRHEAIEAVLPLVPDEAAVLLDKVWWQFYVTMAGAMGMADADERDGYAWQRNQNRKELEGSGNVQ